MYYRSRCQPQTTPPAAQAGRPADRITRPGACPRGRRGALHPGGWGTGTCCTGRGASCLQPVGSPGGSDTRVDSRSRPSLPINHSRPSGVRFPAPTVRRSASRSCCSSAAASSQAGLPIGTPVRLSCRSQMRRTSTSGGSSSTAAGAGVGWTPGVGALGRRPRTRAAGRPVAFITLARSAVPIAWCLDEGRAPAWHGPNLAGACHARQVTNVPAGTGVRRAHAGSGKDGRKDRHLHSAGGVSSVAPATVDRVDPEVPRAPLGDVYPPASVVSAGRLVRGPCPNL